MKKSNKILTAVMAGSSLLLGIGDLLIVNALQPQNLNNAILHLVCGIVVAAAVYFCGFKRILKSAPYLMGGLLLLLLICPVFAYNINGASRWLQVGSFRFAPAMLAMPMLCLFWAYIKDKSADKIFRKNWLILAAVTLLTCGLVMVEPFITMALFIIILSAVMLYLTGVNWKVLTITIIGSLIGFFAVLIAFFRSNPWIRHTDFFKNYLDYDMESAYHTWICLKTLKHSVFVGKYQFPPEMSQTHHIPNAITDSALVAGCGEFGYLFMIGALLLTAAIICCGIIITKRCENPTEKLLAGGMTAVIALPSLTNMFMMWGLLPIGGVTFPFLAYGGSSMIANAFALGGIIAICKESNSNIMKCVSSDSNRELHTSQK